MEATIQFFKEIQTKPCCHDSPFRNERLDIKKIDGIPVNVLVVYYIPKKQYSLKICINEDEPVGRRDLYEKTYNVLDDTQIIYFVEELKNDLKEMRYSKLENKLYTMPIEEEPMITVTNFLCEDIESIETFNSVKECGVCFENTKRKISCCNNVVCYPCQIKIKKRRFYKNHNCFDSTPCPFCRKVIDTHYIYDEDNEDSEDEE